VNERFEELMKCFRKPPGGMRCYISNDGTEEGWHEMHQNGDSMTIGGMTIPLHTDFVVCEEHQPKKHDYVGEPNFDQCDECGGPVDAVWHAGYDPKVDYAQKLVDEGIARRTDNGITLGEVSMFSDPLQPEHGHETPTEIVGDIRKRAGL